MKNEMPDYIETHSGLHFHYLDPKPDDVDIYDIAHALSYTTRWGGHTSSPITVAQHCVLAAQRARNLGYSYEIQMQALLHDAAEAYIGDVPSPIKRHLPDFKALEMLVESAIFECFDVEHPVDPVVKAIDQQMYRWEYRDLMSGDLCVPPHGNPPTIVTWPAGSAEHQFLLYFWELMEERA